MAHRACALSFALVALAACDVGSVGPGPGGDDEPDVDAGVVVPIDAPAAAVALGVTPATATATLGTETTFTVTVTSSHFAGPVTLAATGAPAGWVVAVQPTSVTVADGGTATATVTVRVPSNGAPAPAGQTLTIAATGAAVTASSAAALTVTNDYVIGVGPAGAGTHWGAMNGGVIRIKAGTRLHIRNDDTTAHRIHTGGGVGGFDHQGANMGPGGSYDVTPTDGSDTFYCHVHGQGTGEVNLVIE